MLTTMGACCLTCFAAMNSKQGRCCHRRQSFICIQRGYYFIFTVQKHFCGGTLTFHGLKHGFEAEHQRVTHRNAHEVAFERQEISRVKIKLSSLHRRVTCSYKLYLQRYLATLTSVGGTQGLCNHNIRDNALIAYTWMRIDQVAPVCVT